MIKGKLILGLSLLSLLGGCTSPTAMLGPVYTLSSSGNIPQAGLSYGSSELVTMYTGKSPLENILETNLEEENIQKKTLESEDFFVLVKGKIEKTGKILKHSNH